MLAPYAERATRIGRFMDPQATSTRQRILDTAARLFGERGYTGTSIRDIAAELNIANPSIYHHFASKRQILETLLIEPTRRMAELIETISDDDPDRDAASLIGALLSVLEPHGGIALAAARDAGLAAELAATASNAEPMIQAEFSRLAAEDEAELRSVMAVAALQGAVHHMMRAASTEAEFLQQLSANKPAIIALALRILRD
jgi:AcrR family transcriptional regulator